jgi:hypothetical protein
MTTPAPSSSSTSAQQSGSSGSASGQAPTIAHDTVTQGTSVTGLVAVFAERDARDVAAKIAEAARSYVLEHAQDSIREIRVIGDLSALADVNTLRMLDGQADQLRTQATKYAGRVPERQPAKQPGKIESKGLVADAVAAAGTVIGLVTQLIAGTYTYSGQVIPNAAIGGLDVLVARKLDVKDVSVHVDRFATMPKDSDILKKIRELTPSAADELNPALSRAAWNAAATAQVVTDDKQRLTDIGTEKAGLLKPPPADSGKPETAKEPDPGQLAKLDQEYDDICKRLPDESGTAADAQNLLAEGQALVAAINAFVASAMSAPAAGGPAPVARAAHGEVLSKPGIALLYVQVIAVGDDQTLRQDLIHNEWTNLTGLTAEYALMMPGGGNEAAIFGQESAYAVRHGRMHKWPSDIAREPLHIE